MNPWYVSKKTVPTSIGIPATHKYAQLCTLDPLFIRWQDQCHCGNTIFTHSSGDCRYPPTKGVNSHTHVFMFK